MAYGAMRQASIAGARAALPTKILVGSCGRAFSAAGANPLMTGRVGANLNTVYGPASFGRPSFILQSRTFTFTALRHEEVKNTPSASSQQLPESEAKSATQTGDVSQDPSSSSSSTKASSSAASYNSPYRYWEEDGKFFDIQKFNDMPYRDFGANQHMIINREFRECLTHVVRDFKAPIRYAFAYGSGVFPQSKGGTATEAEIRAIHPKAPLAVQKAQNGSPKMIDFIFAVSHTQHWHSLNMMQNRHHYSAIASLGSGAVSAIQDRWGAGVYFNTYVNVEGILIKYGVVNIETLKRDLRQWDTLYLAGRLHKPVKILRDDPQVRMANQINLLSALRTALLLLPPKFTEMELYATIAGMSYLGDPRMAFPTENPKKVANIVGNNMQNFRALYNPLIESLPNVEFDDPACKDSGWLQTTSVLNLQQDMDPVKRGNMVRRLPSSFRSKLYFEYQKKLQIPQLEFDKMIEESKDEDAESFKRQQGGGFERRIAQDESEELRSNVRRVIKNTINWPSTTQTLKGPFTAGFSKTVRYVGEKMAKYREGNNSQPNKEKAH